jgi:hypothetical protein
MIYFIKLIMIKTNVFKFLKNRMKFQTVVELNNKFKIVLIRIFNPLHVVYQNVLNKLLSNYKIILKIIFFVINN